MDKVSKKLTYEERKEIERLLQEGRSQNFIIFHLKRSKQCIQLEIKKNGGPEQYNAHKSHQRAKSGYKGREPIPLSLNQIQYVNQGMEKGMSISGICTLCGCSKQKIRKYIESLGIDYDPRNHKILQRTSKPGVSFEERIEALEQQVQILTETLRNIR